MKDQWINEIPRPKCIFCNHVHIHTHKCKECNCSNDYIKSNRSAFIDFYKKYPYMKKLGYAKLFNVSDRTIRRWLNERV